MALSAHQVSRWLISSKLSSFLTALQLRKRFQRPGTTLSCGVFAQPHVSSEGCFLQWGFRTYKTSSLWNSSQSADSSRQEINCAQSTLLPPVNEPSQRTPKIPSLDSELSLEGNFQLSENSPLPHLGRLNKLPVYILLANFKSYFVSGKKKNNPLLFICFYYAMICLPFFRPLTY